MNQFTVIFFLWLPLKHWLTHIHVNKTHWNLNQHRHKITERILHFYDLYFIWSSHWLTESQTLEREHILKKRGLWGHISKVRMFYKRWRQFGSKDNFGSSGPFWISLETTNITVFNLNKHNQCPTLTFIFIQY